MRSENTVMQVCGRFRCNLALDPFSRCVMSRSVVPEFRTMTGLLVLLQTLFCATTLMLYWLACCSPLNTHDRLVVTHTQGTQPETETTAMYPLAPGAAFQDATRDPDPHAL